MSTRGNHLTGRGQSAEHAAEGSPGEHDVVMGNEDEALERGLRTLLATTDPVAAVTEQDALRALRDFPLLVLVGPMFGIAEERPGGWQVVSVGEATPQCSRDELAAHLRVLAMDAHDPVEY